MCLFFCCGIVIAKNSSYSVYPRLMSKFHKNIPIIRYGIKFLHCIYLKLLGASYFLALKINNIIGHCLSKNAITIAPRSSIIAKAVKNTFRDIGTLFLIEINLK